MAKRRELADNRDMLSLKNDEYPTDKLHTTGAAVFNQAMERVVIETANRKRAILGSKGKRVRILGPLLEKRSFRKFVPDLVV